MTEVNTYDKQDIVRREAVMTAGPLKIGAYKVRDLDTGEFSETQIHMTYNNMVVAVLTEASARLLARFVTDHLGPNPDIPVKMPAISTEILDALTAARTYVDKIVAKDGGIKICNIAYRIDLEKVDAAIEKLKGQV